MIESISLIKYKYQRGVYSEKYIAQLVEKNIITPKDFKDITSYNYDGFKKSEKNNGDIH